MPVISSKGQVSGGALVGPGAYLTYSAPSPKLTEQSDGVMRFQAHNLVSNSVQFGGAGYTSLNVTPTQGVADPSGGNAATQLVISPNGYTQISTVAVIGASYSQTLAMRTVSGTAQVRLYANGATLKVTTCNLTTEWTYFKNDYVANSVSEGVGVSDNTLGTGSTIIVAFHHVRRTPSVDTYIATTSAAAYDLPYVWSGGVRQGIMVEPAATNLMFVATPSSGHSNITWSGNTLETLDPAGTNTASKMTTTATAGTNIVDSATVAATSCTASVYIKATASELNRFVLRNGTTATILLDITISNFSTGAFSYNTGSAGASVEVLNNGWLRVVLSASAGITSGDLIQFYTGALGNSVAAGQVLYIWCRQLETGTVATSPIITYGAAVARAADNASMLGALFPLSSSEGTLFVEVVTPSSISASTDARPASLNDGSTNNRAFIYANVDGLKFGVRSGGAASADINAGAISASTSYKMACAYTLNDFAASLNGAAVVTDTSGAVPIGLNSLHVGHAANSTHWNGQIKRVAYFPRRLSNAELQAIAA